MMRFCTSPSGVTMISRMRLSDRRINSICLNMWLRRGVHNLGRLAALQLDLDGGRHGFVVGGFDGEHGVYEEPVATRRGNPPRGRMRADHQPEVLQVRHDVADGGRAELESGITRQRAGTDRLTFGDIALDQRLEEGLGTWV